MGQDGCSLATFFLFYLSGVRRPGEGDLDISAINVGSECGFR